MCLSAHAILAVHTIKSVMKDTIVLGVIFTAILKNECFLKLSYSKVREFFYLPWLGRTFLIDTYSACNVLYTLIYLARLLKHKALLLFQISACA